LIEKKGEEALKDLDEKNKKLTKSIDDLKADYQKKEK
jgi:prefoldin subunit 5